LVLNLLTRQARRITDAHGRVGNSTRAVPMERRGDQPMKMIAFGLLLLTTSCSHDDSSSSFCEELQQKNKSCGISGVIDCQSADAETSVVKEAFKTCLVAEDCDAWKSYVNDEFMSQTTLGCFSAHQVKLTGTFSCKDGSGGVSEDVKCDGESNCPDGSDESGC
jgi:hypothetical protein